ncbi:hypothetical protein PEP31012_03671 [Pandoraea eparura]|uniref:MarR family transcriptional regulator n=1 Tax=Pandoraea eparura TaxID=2508291 RepID=A0A5E4X3J1_9BURK|nr:hypothetical protein [Pandoraea eparura]VVE30921.1 hypothetical protein PEP31012_03671 [Pandoraea eparura]
MNQTFSEFATNVAFSISLSKSQCNALLRISLGAEHAQLFAVDVSTVQALERKGLVFWNRTSDGHPEGFGGLTKAGELMVALLGEAGMSIEVTNTARILRRIA